ncbi:MAG: prepilin-type N-terminal cleavage/methylation domain-containing protein [Candidatus Margulisiibacteriota bacterium]
MKLVIKKIKNNRGISLMELVVSITLFTVIMLASTQIFKMVLDGQRGAIAAQNLQENMRYIMEKISKEIRMAQPSDAACGGDTDNKVFNTADDDHELYFKNNNDECINYYLENNRLKIIVDDGVGAIADFITPNKIEVSNLKFYIVDDLISAVSHDVQPYVTMMMDVEAKGLAIHEQKMKIQMTVSLRYYE